MSASGNQDAPLCTMAQSNTRRCTGTVLCMLSSSPVSRSQAYAASYWVGVRSLNSLCVVNKARLRATPDTGSRSSQRTAARRTGSAGTGTEVAHQCLKVALVQSATDGGFLVKVGEFLHGGVV